MIRAESDATLSPGRDNPYVGPQSFSREEREFFRGRERETNDLEALLVARRLVLFYAQSGAGKTSLIRAGLAPRLEEKRGFEVLPVSRVSGTALTHVAPDNVYSYNLMADIDEVDRGDAARFAQLRLTDFLLDLVQVDGTYAYIGSEEEEDDAAPGETGVDASVDVVEIRPRALIIDQFEELFMAYPGVETYEMRVEFFRQLAEAMDDDPYLYVLLSMRADYVHHLSRYVHLLPDGLRTRYYMSRMRPDDALRAVKEPAKLAGRPFAEGVAEELVTHLRRERVQDSGEGDEEWTLGETVEPVQLQVVCYQLWQSLLGAEGDEIRRDDLTRLARDVLADGEERDDPLAAFIDSALGSYYEQSLVAALKASATDTREEYLRDWFSRKLITDAGTRGYLLRGAESTAGVPESVIMGLLDHHLLRSEERKGSRWVELIHDSFIEPIRYANDTWTQRRMREKPWVAAAYRWEQQERPANLLLRGELLAVAQAEAGDLSMQPRHVRHFLRESGRVESERKQAETERKRAETEATNRRLRLQRLGLIGVSLFAVVMALTAVVFLVRERNANALVQAQQDELVETNQKLETQRDEFASLNQELISTGIERDLAFSALVTQQNELSRTVAELQVTTRELDHAKDELEATILTRDTQRFLSEANYDGALLLSVAAAARDPERAVGLMLESLDLAYTSREITGAFRIETNVPLSVAGAHSVPQIHTGIESGTVSALADGLLWTWNPVEPEDVLEPRPITGTLLAVTGDGRRVATATERGVAVLDTVSSEWETVPVERGQQQIVEGVFSPDHSTLAFVLCTEAASVDESQVSQSSDPTVKRREDCQIHVRDATSGEVAPVGSGEDSVLDVAFLDETTLIWVDGAGRILSQEIGEAVAPQTLGNAPPGQITTDLLVMPEGNRLLTAGCLADDDSCDGEAGGFVQWWLLEGLDLTLMGSSLRLPAPVNGLARAMGSMLVAALDADGVVVVWEADAGKWPALACEAAGRNLTYQEWVETMGPIDLRERESEICGEFGHDFGLHISFALNEVEACNTTWALEFKKHASPEARSTFTADALALTFNRLIAEYAGGASRQSTSTCLDQVGALLGGNEPDGLYPLLQTMGDWESDPDSSPPLAELNEVVETLESWSPVVKDTLFGRVVAEYEALCPLGEEEVDLTSGACQQWLAISLDSRGLAYGAEPVVGDTNVDRLWLFEGQVGDLVSVSMDAVYPDRLDPLLTLYDETGQPVVSNDDYGGSRNARINLALPETGLYLVEAGAYSGAGEYILSLSNNEPELLQLPAEQLVEAFSRWSFDGELGQILRLTVRDQSNQPLNIMTLARPDERATPRPQAELALALTATGRYSISLSGDPAEPVSLSVTDESDALQGDVVYGQTVSGRLTEEGVAYWLFDGEDAEAASVTLSGLTSPLEVTLFGPEGQALGRRQNGAEPSLNLISAIPGPGSYLIAARAVSETVDASFTLALDAVDTLPIPQACDPDAGEPDYGPIIIGSEVILGRHTFVNGSENWNDSMLQYVGQVATVTDFAGSDSQGCPVVRVDIDDGDWYWRIRAMLLP